jgi:hypothetical protein
MPVASRPIPEGRTPSLSRKDHADHCTSILARFFVGAGDSTGDVGPSPGATDAGVTDGSSPPHPGASHSRAASPSPDQPRDRAERNQRTRFIDFTLSFERRHLETNPSLTLTMKSSTRWASQPRQRADRTLTETGRFSGRSRGLREDQERTSEARREVLGLPSIEATREINRNFIRFQEKSLNSTSQGGPRSVGIVKARSSL